MADAVGGWCCASSVHRCAARALRSHRGAASWRYRSTPAVCDVKSPKMNRFQYASNTMIGPIRARDNAGGRGSPQHLILQQPDQNEHCSRVTCAAYTGRPLFRRITGANAISTPPTTGGRTSARVTPSSIIAAAAPSQRSDATAVSVVTTSTLLKTGCWWAIPSGVACIPAK